MEDATVKYDGTVRNARNLILQYIYGSNGLDPTRQKIHKLKITEMGNEAIRLKYKFTENELKNHKFKNNDKYYTDLLVARDNVRKGVRQALHNYRTMRSDYILPVNFERVIRNAINMPEKGSTKLDADYVEMKLNDVLKYENTPLTFMSAEEAKNKRSLKIGDDMISKTIFKLGLHEYLAPKKCIIEYGFNKETFDAIISEVIAAFNKCAVQPGEMVGIVAAQSIGEPVTQMSVIGSTKILINGENKYYGRIDKYIDNLISEYGSHVVDLGNDIKYLNIDELPNEKAHSVIGVSENEKISWNKIKQVSRHPANGKLVKVTTTSGREVTATLSHSFLIRGDNKIVPIPGSDLKLGMRIPISNRLPMTNISNSYDKDSFKIDLDYDFGYYCGLYLSRGTIQDDNIIIQDSTDETDQVSSNYNLANMHIFLKENFGTDKKYIGRDIMMSNKNMLSGLIDGFYHFTNAFISTFKELISDISLCLQYFGVRTTIHSIDDHYALEVHNNSDDLKLKNIIHNCDDKIPSVGTIINETNNILGSEERLDSTIPIDRNTIGEYIDLYKNHSESFRIKEQIKNLEQAYLSNIIWDKIINLEILDDPKEYVYDIGVPGNDSFMVNESIMVHNTLNTFHMAGISTMGTSTLGVPRMKEILSVSGNMKTPRMEIHLSSKFKKNDSMADKLASYIKYTTLEDIRESLEVLYDPNPQRKDGFMDRDNVHNVFYSQVTGKSNCKADIDNLPWLVRISLNKEKMMNKDIKLLDIKSKFCSHWEKRYSELKGVKKEERVLLEKISQVAVVSNNESDKTPMIHMRFDMTEFNFATITSFVTNIIDRFRLKGMENINDAGVMLNDQIIEFNETTGEVEKNTQHLIITSGVNMVGLRYLNGIDLNRTVTNDIRQIYEIFGIEAARAVLVKEIKFVFATSGNDFNFQHLSILVDIMTHNGFLVSIDRHGMTKIDTDPLSRASFEKTVDQLFNAAVFGEVDQMRSVSARIMAGMSIKGGTGLPNITFDTDLIEKSEYVEDLDIYGKKATELNVAPIINDIIKEVDEEEDEDDEGGFMPIE
jgi:DNA-directed RNA polymerase beta' subunit